MVTTGNEGKEPDVIETLPEEAEGDGEGEEAPALAPRVDPKRRSNRRVHRHHSMKRGNYRLVQYFSLGNPEGKIAVEIIAKKRFHLTFLSVMTNVYHRHLH